MMSALDEMVPRPLTERSREGSQSPGPRIVIAYDASAEADRAVAVVGTAPWPPTTVIRIVTSSTGLGGGSSSFALVDESRTHARATRASIETAQTRAAGTLVRNGIDVETAIITGQPGRGVVRDATAFGADLIVSGGRGQHPLVATLLGSVSTEIAERAPASVLIARVESIGRVILATDGSAGAEAATFLVATSALFSEKSVRVVGVASRPSNYTGSVLSGDEADGSYADSLATARRDAETHVDAALQRLARSGHQAEADVRVGKPADEILGAAREWPADLIVVGSTGKSLVRRLILGSVARTVLQGAPSSVVVARPGRSLDPI
jgi:nucleotide-binding universal stress UspA family protein